MIGLLRRLWCLGKGRPGIELSPALAALSPKSASLEMTVTRADGTVETRVIETFFNKRGKPIRTTETFGG